LPDSPLNASTYTYLWTRSIVEELVRSGVDTFFIAPGSRSTPLTVAVAQHPRARAVVHVDERGTAFAALGYGRATGRPAG
jgi:2-succinyl-5-enolpyruvyl-6-hydroxy-3-cyclohexene-1-carboxylate synthase